MSLEAARGLLRLDIKVTKKEIKAAYRKLARQVHPDVNPDGLEKSKEINAAYGVLSGG